MQATPVFLVIARGTSGQDLACEQAEAGTPAVQMHQCCECRTTKSHTCNYMHLQYANIRKYGHIGQHIELGKTQAVRT